jgi:ParB-like chromosome segregation protein Spo0J
MNSPYQIMPDLTAIEMAELRASIEVHGIQVPILIDENNVVIDGHHRQKLAAELGVPCPHEVRNGLTDEQKRVLGRTLNTARRHLTREQIRGLVAGQLRDAPEQSDRQVAKDLGVSPSTVGAVRADLVQQGDVSKLDTHKDSKGRQQPATKPAKKAATPTTPTMKAESAKVAVTALSTTTKNNETTDVKVFKALEGGDATNGIAGAILTLANNPDITTEGVIELLGGTPEESGDIVLAAFDVLSRVAQGYTRLSCHETADTSEAA